MNQISKIKKNSKTLKNYYNKKNFIEEAEQTIFKLIEEIDCHQTRKKVEASGLENIHNYFSVDLVPFLQFGLGKIFSNHLYKQMSDVVKKEFNKKEKFYIDKDLNFRIVYPYHLAKKSILSRSVYRCLNLKNYKDGKNELLKALAISKNYKMDQSDLTKLKHFGKLPVPCYQHGPHRDTWFGHSYNGINLWWGITKVTKFNGMMLFKKVYDFNLNHISQPAYVKDEYNLGQSIVPKLNKGDLLLFDPEILHATRLNTSNKTRIVFSGRIDFKKPQFYKKTKDLKAPFWLESKDVNNGNFLNIKKFIDKKNLKDDKKKYLKKNTPKQIEINKKIKNNSLYKIIKKDLFKEKLINISFDNARISIVKSKNQFYAFNSLCPHLRYDLSLSNLNGSTKLTCQGHGVTFDMKSGNSTCKSFNLKKYKIKIVDKFLHLQT
jgi:nitrite reductase/ring-hydroxylating ferredoxin subunit